MKPGSRYGATVVGFMKTWFLPVLFVAIGFPFTIIGLLMLMLGTRGQIVRNALPRGAGATPLQAITQP